MNKLKNSNPPYDYEKQKYLILFIFKLRLYNKIIACQRSKVFAGTYKL